LQAKQYWSCEEDPFSVASVSNEPFSVPRVSIPKSATKSSKKFKKGIKISTSNILLQAKQYWSIEDDPLSVPSAQWWVKSLSKTFFSFFFSFF
jgi:hypothetical protein